MIPKNVEDIEGTAFRGCKLENIQVADDNTVYDSRNNCNAIIETEKNKLVVGCKNTIIPNGVKELGDYAFYVQSSLENIVIPDSVTKIGYGVFLSSRNLRRSVMTFSELMPSSL